MSYVYAVVFDSGVVKFGRTENLNARLTSHVSDGLVHGVSCITALVCRVSNAIDSERELLRRAAASMSLADHGREYFTGDADDAFEVMVESGFLPIFTQPIKIGTSLSFVVSRTTSIAAKYEVVKSSEELTSESIKENILRNTKGRELTEGVIYNRVRNAENHDVKKCLDEMVEKGLLVLREKKHPKNHKVIRYYINMG